MFEVEVVSGGFRRTCPVDIEQSFESNTRSMVGGPGSGGGRVMGSVQQAVLEFDEEVQAPWRPRLVVVGDVPEPAVMRTPLSHPSRRSPSRVGSCRPPVSPAGPGRPGTVRPDGRLAPPAPARSPRRPAGRVSAAPRPAQVRNVRLRLTRRARRLAVVLALAAGVTVGSLLGPLFGSDHDALRLTGESSVVVQSGDTLWSIASSLDAGGDVRALVDEIQQLNGLSGAELLPGQTLRLP
jgi:nucleoid-associated protein YgaU